MQRNKDKNVKMAWLLAAIAILIVVFDQIVKIWVKTHFYLGEDFEVTSWFHIKFIENNGMAFGMEIISKILLTLGRIAAVIVFIWALKKILSLRSLRVGFLVAVALIIAGAAGNVIDCVFYGEIFNNPPPPEVATLFPVGGGYGTWFEGRVVDMLYFPLFSFTWPEWMPGIGGSTFEFFQYIFNIADASITIGVLLMIIFYSKDASIAFNYLFKGKEENSEQTEEKEVR